MLGCEMDKLSVESEYPAVRGFAQAGHVLGDGIEYRLGIAGRVGDDAEHFGGRSLLLQRLSKGFCASASSRVRWSSCFCRSAAEELRRRAAVGTLRRLTVVVFRRRAFIATPPVAAPV